MASAINYILFSSIVLLSLITSGKALTCYDCASHPILPDEACLKGRASQMATKSCPSGFEYCSVTLIKTPATFLSSAGLTVTRSCSANNSVPDVVGAVLDGDWTFCQGSYCNHGHRYYLPLGTLALSLMIAFMGM